MQRATIGFLTCLAVCGCASTPPIWTKAPEAPQTRQIGTVIRIGEVPTINTSSDAQRDVMSRYGLAGALATEILGTKRGYPVYRVKVDEELELGIATRDEFVVGDCVQVSYPADTKRHIFDLGEASMTKTTGCPPIKGE